MTKIAVLFLLSIVGFVLFYLCGLTIFACYSILKIYKKGGMQAVLDFFNEDNVVENVIFNYDNLFFGPKQFSKPN